MNTKTLLFFLTVIVLAFSLSACGDCSKKIDCPGYHDDTLDSWFPYKDNQRLIFLDDNNQRDTITLKLIELTEAYQKTSGLFGPSPHCVANKTFESIELDTAKQRKTDINFTAGEQFRELRFSIGNNDFTVFDFKGNGLGQITSGSRNMEPQVLPVVTINNQTFYNVIEAVGDTVNNKTPGFYKIYYKQGEGLVSYSLYPSLQTWVKQ